MSTGSAAPQRILIRCPNWLGDVVMITPTLRALRAHFPEAKITALLPEPLLPLLEGLTDCDELWPLRSRDGGLVGWQQDIVRIRAGRFDLGLVVPESISSALLMRLGGVSRVFGFARDPLRRFLLHEDVAAPESWGKRRLVSKERYGLTLVEPLGIRQGEVRTRLEVRESDSSRLGTVLEKLSLDAAELLASRPIVLAPGASFGESKCWPTESFAALADRLARGGHSVVLLGGPGEGERLGAVRRAMNCQPIVLDGVLDLGALKALLRGAGALVANDAGARHIAAAFEVPSVIFFGPTSVEKTADNLHSIEVLETEHECRPCYLRTCPIDHRCLRSIDVDQAEVALERVMARGASSVDYAASDWPTS